MVTSQFRRVLIMDVVLISLLCIIMQCNGNPWPEVEYSWPQSLPSRKILYENNIRESPPVTLEQVTEKSSKFPIPFPTNSTRCAVLVNTADKNVLESHINSAYPFLHEKTLQLYTSFLSQKQQFGTTVERALYQNMSLLQFVDRLLTKRAVSFVGPQDRYLLLDGTKAQGNWEPIGTENQTSPLILQNYISYDEMKLAALLTVSSQTYFIENEQIRNSGIVIGAVGPRLDKPLVMEYREIMKTASQNTHQNGYGQFFVPTLQGIVLNFYGDTSLTYEELTWRNVFNSSRYMRIGDDKYFDKELYRKRQSLAVDSILLEANQRAKAENRKAAVHVVLLGQGSITPEQDDLFVDSFRDRIPVLGAAISNVKKICFSSDIAKSCDCKIPAKGHPDGGIKLQNGAPCGTENELKVVTYNWNANALPGNEYWLGDLSTSQIENCTQVLELHNSQINDKISAENLRIATPSRGMVTFSQYLDLHKNDQ